MIGPSQGQRDKKQLIGQKTNCFFIDHKIGEKGHTQPFLRKEISKRTTTKEGPQACPSSHGRH
jgi:hypothetical protein